MASKQPDYDPKGYWTARTDPNTAKGRLPERVAFDEAYIAQATEGLTRVLELGPGTGRTFGAYPRGRRLTTLDLVETYRENLNDRARDLGLDLDQHFLPDPAMAFAFGGLAFDCGVAFQVFIHMPPDLFAQSFSELCRVSRKIVVAAGIHGNSPTATKPIGNHVFAHDYLAAASSQGFVLNDVILREGHLYFSAERRDFQRPPAE